MTKPILLALFRARRSLWILTALYASAGLIYSKSSMLVILWHVMNAWRIGAVIPAMPNIVFTASIGGGAVAIVTRSTSTNN